MKPSGPGLFVCQKIFNQFQFHYLWWVCSYFHVSSWFSLGRLHFPKNVSIILGWSFWGACSLLWSFVFVGDLWSLCGQRIPWLRSGQTCLDGSPPSAHEAMRLAGREGGCCGGTPLACHSAIVSCFYGDPEKCFYSFFWKHSQLWNSLLLSLHTVFSQPAVVPSLGPFFKHHFPSLSPCPHQETQDSGWGMQAAAQIMGTVLTVSCLLQTSCSISHQSSFCPSLFPHCEWAFLSVGTSLHFQFLSRGAGTFLFPLFVFSFFHPTWLHGDSSCSFRCLIFC